MAGPARTAVNEVICRGPSGKGMSIDIFYSVIFRFLQRHPGKDHNDR